MEEALKKFREYLDYIERHYNNVQKAWDLISKKCEAKGGFRFLSDDFVYHAILEDVINHDTSKLSANEFTQYRQKFFPCKGEEINNELFLSAWEHHKSNNVHHWQNWTNQPETPYDDMYLVMMVVDWVAMGFEFNNTAKSYYEDNKDNIDLPEWAIGLMYEIFDCIY